MRASWYMGLPPLQLIGLNLSPGQTADYHYAWNVAADIRLIRVFGHRHFWTPNFSTWIERANGQTELIYQSYDWEDMPTYRYDSVVKNPALDPTGKTDGAVSGVTMLHAGDKLHFNCHIEFTDQHAATDEDAPTPSGARLAALREPGLHGRDVHPVRQRLRRLARPAGRGQRDRPRLRQADAHGHVIRSWARWRRSTASPPGPRSS